MHHRVSQKALAKVLVKHHRSAMGKDGAGITDAAGKVVYTGTQVAEQIDKLPQVIQNYLTSRLTSQYL